MMCYVYVRRRSRRYDSILYFRPLTDTEMRDTLHYYRYNSILSDIAPYMQTSHIQQNIVERPTDSGMYEKQTCKLFFISYK